MKEALKDVPVSFVPEPYGIIRINNNLYTNETMPPNGVRSIDVKTLDDEIDTS